MANSFVLTARLVLLPPTNIKNVVQLLNSQLGQIETKVKLSVPQRTLTALRRIDDSLRSADSRVAGMVSNMQRFQNEAVNASNRMDRISKQNIGGGRNVGGYNTSIARQVSEVGRLSHSLTNLQKVTNKSKDEFERFGQQAAISLRRFGAFTLAAGTFIKLTNAFSTGIREAIAFDLQMTKLAQVVGVSRQAVVGLENEITRLGVSLGVSSSKIADVALTLAQAGLNAEKTRIAMEVLAKTELAPTFENITDTGEAAIAVLSQFGGGVQSLSKDFSEINRISAKFAVESSDLTTAISKAGGVFQTAGGSLRDLLALFTSVRQTTRESADSIATGFRTIFARLQRPRTQNFLEAIGIDLKDSEGLFVGPYKAIQRLSEALKDLETTDPRFAKIIEEIGGYRQISRVIPLIKQFEVAERARLEAIRAGDSLTKDAIRAQESFAIKISKVREEFLSTIRAFANDSNVKSFTDSLLRMASAFNKVLDAARPLLPVLGILGVISGGPRVARIYKAFRREETRTPFAVGGVVPGVGNSDSVKADLTPGEYVIKKSSARKIGYDTLHAMNNHAQKFADGGRVKFNTGGSTIFSDDEKELQEKLKQGNKHFRKFFGFNIEDVVGGRVKYTSNTYDSKGNSPNGFFAGKYRSKNDEGLPEILAGKFLTYNGLIHEALHGIDLQSRYKNYSSSSRGGKNPIASIARKFHNEEGLRLLYLLSGVRENQKGANYLLTPEETFAHIGAAYISGPRKLQKLLSEQGFAPSVYKDISQSFKQVQDYVKIEAVKNRIFRPKYGNFKDPAKIESGKVAISDDKIAKLIGGYSGPGPLGGRQKEALEHFGKVKKYISNYPKRFSDPEAARRYRLSQRQPFFSKDFSKDYYGFGAYASKEGKRALGLGALGSILGIAGAIALTQGFATGGKVLPSSGDFNDLLISHFGYNMLGKAYPVNRETKFHGRLVSPKGKHYFDLPFLKGNQFSQEFHRFQNESNFNRDIYEGGIPSIDQYKISKKAYEDAVETMTKGLGLNPRTYTKHIIGYDKLGLNGNLTEGVFSSLSKNIYYNSAADYHTSYNTFLEEMIHALDNKGLDAGKFASQGARGKQHPFYQLNNKIRNSYGMFEFSDKMVGTERGFGGNFNFDDVMYVTNPVEVTAKLIKSRLDKHNPALLPLIFGSKTTKLVDDTIQQIRRSPKFYFATGGGVPGTGNQDTVPALLTPGEFVFNKKTAQKIGYSNLERMNKIGRYASGGTVSHFKSGGGVSGGSGVFSGAATFLALSALGSIATDATTEVDKFGEKVLGVSNLFTSLQNSLVTAGVQFIVLTKLIQGINNYRGDNLFKSSKGVQYDASSRIVQNSFIAGNGPNAQRKGLVAGQRYTTSSVQAFIPQRTNDIRQYERAGANIRALQERIFELNSARTTERDVLVTPKGIGGYPGAKPYIQKQTVTDPKTQEQIALERKVGIEQARLLAIRKNSLAFDNSAVATYKKTELATIKMAGSFEKLGHVLVGLSVLGLGASTLFSQFASNAENRGDEKSAIRNAGVAKSLEKGTVGAGVGYGVGGVIGGLIGLIGGPAGIAAGTTIGGALGAGVGAAFGGITGYLGGTSEATDRLRTNRFNKIADAQNRNLVALNKNPDFSFDVSSGVTKSLISNRLEQLKGSTDKETVRAAIGEDLENVRGFLLNSARQFGKDAQGDKDPQAAISKFNKATQSVAEYYARFSGVTLAEVQSEFEGIVKVSQKQFNAQDELAKNAGEAAERLRRVSLISSAISQVADSLHKFDATISGISENVTGTIGGSQYKTSNILANNENVTNFGRFENELAKIASPFGETGRAAAKDALDATKLINTLPQVLVGAANTGLLSEEGDIDTIIKKRLGENNPFADSVLNNLKQELISSGRDVTLTKIKSDPQGFAKQLTNGLENIIKPFQEAEPLINQELEKLSSGLALRRQIEFKFIDLLNNALDIRIQKEDALSAATERPTNFGLQSNLLVEQFRNIVGDAAPSGANLADIGRILAENNQRFNQINASIATGPANIQDRANLELERDSVSETIERLRKGLEFISSGKEIGLVQRQLDVAKQERQTKQSFLTNYAFGSTEARRNIDKTLFNTQRVTATGNIDSVRGDERDAILSLAQNFSEIKLGAFGGLTGKEFINNVTANKLQSTGQFTKEEIDQIRKGQSTEEENLTTKLGEAYDRAIRANEILALEIKTSQDDLVRNLSDSFDSFLNELKTIFEQAEATKKEEEKQQKSLEKDVVEEKLERRKKAVDITGQTFSDNEVAALKRNRTANRKLVDVNERQQRLAALREEVQRQQREFLSGDNRNYTFDLLQKKIGQNPQFRQVFGEDNADTVFDTAGRFGSGLLGGLKILGPGADVNTGAFYESLIYQIGDEEEKLNKEREAVQKEFAPGERKTQTRKIFNSIYQGEKDSKGNLVKPGIDSIEEQDSLKNLKEKQRLQRDQEQQQSAVGPTGIGFLLASASIGSISPEPELPKLKTKESLQQTIDRYNQNRADFENKQKYYNSPDARIDFARITAREEEKKRRENTDYSVTDEAGKRLIENNKKFAAEQKRREIALVENKKIIADAAANRPVIKPKKPEIKKSTQELLQESGFYVDTATASAIDANKSNTSARQNNPALKNQETINKNIERIAQTSDKEYAASKPFYDKAKTDTGTFDTFGKNLGAFGNQFTANLTGFAQIINILQGSIGTFTTSAGTLNTSVNTLNTAIDIFKKSTITLGTSFNKFEATGINLATALNVFSNNDKLVNALNQFPKSLSVEGNVKAEIILNGLEVLTKLEPGIKSMIEETVNKALKNKDKKDKI